MKVIKRDGRAVDYDRTKIQIVIEKANKEVSEDKRASKEDIKKIIKYIEELNKKRILVEDIQDIIEEKLMEQKKYELAKKYIVYRYTRALVRKQNTTDETILGIIRKDSKEDMDNSDEITPAAQRNYIASEVSRDLTRRLLLPEKIAKAEEEGILNFHNADYFVHPMINSSLLNIKDILENGTVINGKLIETPNTFLVACLVISQVIAAISNNQYGGQSIDFIHLGKYLNKTYKKFKNQIEEEYRGEIKEEFIENLVQNRVKSELTSGIEILNYQINTLKAINGKIPSITFFLHIEENDPYLKENVMIIEEILKQRYEGIKDENGDKVTISFPKLVYVLDECNSLKGGKYDYITKLAIKCSQKRQNPVYISAKKMRENHEGNVFSPIGEHEFLSLWKDSEDEYKFEGRFNQGTVTINLPQIAILSEENEKQFWRILDERLDLCFEALMCRHYSLVGISTNISPIHWIYGALTRLSKEEKIDSLLYGGYSTITLGYMGIYEMTKLMTKVSPMEEAGHEFAVKVLKYLNKVIEKWRTETNIGFVLSGIENTTVLKKFAKIDREKYGTIKGINDKEIYTSSFDINEEEKINILEELQYEADLQKYSLGGHVTKISNINEENVNEIIKYAYENIEYLEFNKKG